MMSGRFSLSGVFRVASSGVSLGRSPETHSFGVKLPRILSLAQSPGMSDTAAEHRSPGASLTSSGKHASEAPSERLPSIRAAAARAL